MKAKLKDGDLLTAADAAKVLNLSREMVVLLCNRGRLPCVRTVGGTRLLWAADVQAEVRRRRKAKVGNRRGQVRVVP